MDTLLKLLEKDSLVHPDTLAKILNIKTDEVYRQLQQLKKDKKLLAFKAILSEDVKKDEKVEAIIEVRLTPERDGGFNHLAERISKFDEVTSCYLVSGGYDLLVFVEGRSLQQVALFVSEKLSTLGGVLSTSTHFRLKTYKEHGVMMHIELDEERPAVSP
ncbi:MAG: Lrp/AsnC family transcriptional regulator [Verrucomicrobiota bacterium]|nr:Lrp/AsnC family transcriptional regulator [Verrucomicrobiota bacterium]